MRFWGTRRPLIFGHRGASMHAPENTLSAFRLALEMGADGIELDITPSADGVPMVIHDPNLERTTDGTGDVRRLSAAEIQKYDAGIRFSSKYAGERVPTLKEVFEAFGNRTRYNLDMKTFYPEDRPIVRTILGLIEQYKLAPYILISSFSLDTLRWFTEETRQLRLGVLISQYTPHMMLEDGRRWGIRYEALHPNHALVDEAAVRRARPQRKKLVVWTVNEAERKRELTLLGVDAIITDDPVR
ncbi:MAG: glycerophosphodiester phosphodiesterase [Armatimonadetes bacterium JP3_11]|nr:MAG: glycerophosphodiester phosphodiesterase [Armatimonadetes bacterium CP1_7O]OYT74667.1 MAG: glycerophosphodiester phosphodiesterase [Armatimonadetes bacterium JP3_11]RMH10356.1 MAG: glycerophosphodiester phosphodiesterase [Armatimonadota bacterium]